MVITFIAYNPKYQIWCELDVPCAHYPNMPILLICEVPDPVYRSGYILVVIFRVSIQTQISHLVCIGRSMCPRPQYTDLTYMEGTGPSDLIKIIFGNHVYSWHAILNIKFGVIRTFHVPITPVCRFDLYGRYQILWTDHDNFW